MKFESVINNLRNGDIISNEDLSTKEKSFYYLSGKFIQSYWITTNKDSLILIAARPYLTDIVFGDNWNILTTEEENEHIKLGLRR